jgi:hypothetical protein
VDCPVASDGGVLVFKFTTEIDGGQQGKPSSQRLLMPYAADVVSGGGLGKRGTFRLPLVEVSIS